MKSTMHKNLLRTIKKSLGRYIAIMAIIALGSGIFVGLLSSKSDMIATGQEYLDTHNMFDFRLLSNYGWTDKELADIASMDGVSGAEGSWTMDVMGKLSDRDKEDVFQLYSIPDDISTLYLMGGRMPQNPGECFIDGKMVDESILGKTLTICSNNREETLDSIEGDTFTIVGYGRSPLFMDFNRGNSSLGDGSVASFVYLPREAFSADVYTEADITLEGLDKAYTEAYQDQIDGWEDALEPAVLGIAQQRFEGIRQDAEKEYADGYQEYKDGLQEIADAKKKLQDAYDDLTDGQKEIDENRSNLEDGEQQLQDAAQQIERKKRELADGKAELDRQKEETYRRLNQTEEELLNQETELSGKLVQVQEALPQVEAGISQMEQGLNQISDGIMQADAAIAQLQAIIEQMGGVGTEVYEQQLLELETQKNALLAQQKELEAQKQALTVKQQELTQAMEALQQGLAQIEGGKAQLAAGREQADREFADAEAEIASGESQLQSAETEIAGKAQELSEGRQKLAQAQQEVDDGWQEYHTQKADADREIADAEDELKQAEIDLADARKEIEDLEDAKVYLLGRNTNMGYQSLDSNSDIVAGVSKVFPAFFLLVAALVCITTMTRMVEEERTQIGTLKALGYSNGSIIGKYLVYAGSAAVLGCGLGVVAGSVIFPKIIWNAYNIMMSLEPKLTIQFDIPLCIVVVAAYTAVILLVTWYTCRRSLREVPAELIRPKAPTAGKKIFLEYMPFWKTISFLNKVTLRNIFRYHQRLLMMLVGIGGCTALLMTGFGMGDSIKDIVSYQYEEVTQYDMQTQFEEGRTEQEQKEFAESLADKTDSVQFAYQASMDIVHDSKMKSAYMVATDNGFSGIFDLHSGKEIIESPKPGEAVISVGIAEDLNIHKGDSITARSKDMQDITVTITGIFDNNIDNFLLISQDTLEQQWQEREAPQLAFLTVKDGMDVHNVGAGIKDMDAVTAVFINQDMADLVSSMLGAMDMIVLTVVICAGILAVIVLYNLTNINITERLREIATIKVLGFRSGETAAYVFKENILLSTMGCVLGLGFGKLLLNFVMDKIKIDTIWFQSRIDPISIVYSIIITMLMAFLVDFILYFRLEKINMAEALKSVE